ncbi:uncharacterized protein LOC128959407 [Oppia nitens]|uniref:uncharacterized protein LOC128959407 n=1 Tax=Oppia nitens TaxID=1686743 RepID=UPI0023DAA8C0|nr:uncharacterized protein LOC128959407 [Oppia nitens]
MKSTVVSCLVIICTIYAYNCATINFSAWRTSTIYKNFDLKCNYTLNRRSEWFSSLSLIVNNTIFYSYDNYTIGNPRFYPRPGIQQIIRRSPGYISINNANKTTSGSYRCQVNYSGGRAIVSQTYKITVPY